MITARLADVIVILVCLVWAANFLLPFVSSYQSDPQLNLVFMSIVGGALALSRERQRRHCKKDDDTA